MLINRGKRETDSVIITIGCAFLLHGKRKIPATVIGNLPMGRGRTGRRKKGAGSCVPTGSDAFDVKKYEKGTDGKNSEKIFAGND